MIALVGGGLGACAAVLLAVEVAPTGWAVPFAFAVVTCAAVAAILDRPHR